MADPFDALRALGTGAQDPSDAPDPAFASALRARLERVLLASAAGGRSGAVPPPSSSPSSTATARPAPTPAPLGGPVSLSPYLTVADARAALAFYAEAFGAVPHGETHEMPDGRIGHAEVRVGTAVVMLADEYPEAGLIGPLALGGVSATMHLEVADADAAVARAVAAGAVLEREVADAPYGRTGVVRDPAGHRWMLQTPAPAGSAADPDPAPARAPRHGDVGYQTLYVPDVERAKAFFGNLLGWTFGAGGSPGGWEAQGVSPMTGLMGGAVAPEVQLCFQVDDVRAAVQRVRVLGGTAQDPQDRPYGRLAECVDDQGMPFQVWQPPA